MLASYIFGIIFILLFISIHLFFFRPKFIEACLNIYKAYLLSIDKKAVISIDFLFENFSDISTIFLIVIIWLSIIGGFLILYSEWKKVKQYYLDNPRRR